MAFFQSPLLPRMPTSSSSQPTSNIESTHSSALTSRSRKQLSLFIAGTAFFGLSAFITRRSLTRRYRTSVPQFYQPSNRPSLQFSGAMDAFEALNVATINVLSISMMLAGGALWAFDIWGLDDMRRRTKEKLGFEGSEKDAEEEFEEWLATTLARKEMKAEARAKEGTNEKGRQR